MSRNYALEIQNLLLDLHILRRRWSVDKFSYNSFYGADLSASQAHALIILSGSLKPGISELATLLNLDQSSTSRLVKVLSERGLLIAKHSVEDSRGKCLKISSKGIRVVDDILLNQDRATLAALGDMSKADAISLGNQLNLIADGLSSRDDYGPVKGIHPVSIALRRMTPAYGILGDTNTDTLNFTQWQILRVIHRHGYASLSDLYQLLPYEPSVQRRIVGNLVKRALLEKGDTSQMRSRFKFTLTATGTRLLDSKLNLHVQKIREILKKDSRIAPEKILRIADEINQGAVALIKDEGMDARVITSSSDLDQARRLWIRDSSHLDNPEYLPSGLFTEDQVSIGVYHKKELVGAISLSLDKTVNLVLLAKSPSVSAEQVLLVSLRLLFSIRKEDKVTISRFCLRTLHMSQTILIDDKISRDAICAVHRTRSR